MTGPLRCALVMVVAAWVAAADDSLVVRTEHFVAVGDLRPEQIEATAKMFEVLADSVHQLVPSVRAVFPRPVVIVALAKRPSGIPSGIKPGFFAGPPLAYAVADVGEDDIGEAGVEFVRQLVGSSLENVPLWVEVGCSEYLRTLRIDRERESSHVIVGAPVARHVVALRSRGLPMLTVLSATGESPAFTEADNRRQFIAQSWLLVHYLMTERSRQEQLSAFLDLLARHVEPEAAFQQAFAETHETIGHRLSDYYSRQLFATRQLPLRTPDSHDTHGSRDRDGKTTSYPGPQVPSLLAITSDLLLRAGRVKESAAMAAGTIRDATIADPDAVGVLAKARFLQGRPDEARALFQKAIARPEAGVLPRYYYAEFLVSHASPGSAAATPSAQDASVASQALTPLLDTFPNHPDLLSLLGLADLGLHNPGSALRRFEDAIRLFPRHEYAILIAAAEIAGGDVASARALLEPLATRGKTDDVRTQAQLLLRNVPQATAPASTSASASASGQAAMPVFRAQKPGEQRESGTLTEIACSSQSQWVILHVRLRDRELRVASTRLDLIDFISYGRPAPSPIACGTRQDPEAVLITWRAESTTPPGADGIVEAVEFLPSARP